MAHIDGSYIVYTCVAKMEWKRTNTPICDLFCVRAMLVCYQFASYFISVFLKWCTMQRNGNGKFYWRTQYITINPQPYIRSISFFKEIFCLLIISLLEFSAFNFFTGPQPFLTFLPDNVMLMVMSLLDIPSLLQLSQVNKRCHLLFMDEYLWTDVDLSTVPKLNVGKFKKIIRDRLSPRLWRLKLQSNAVECQRKHTLRPIITSVALDELFKKCPCVKIIHFHNCDFGQVQLKTFFCVKFNVL